MSKMVFDGLKIAQMLPHRYPFLMVDNVYEVEPGLSGIGEKLYTIDEWFFQGHFPNNPIVPGVLLIESAAQTVAVVYQSVLFSSGNDLDIQSCDIRRHVGYLTKVDVKFLNIVRPGNTVINYIKIVKKFGKMSVVDVCSEVNKKIIMKGELFVSEQ